MVLEMTFGLQYLLPVLAARLKELVKQPFGDLLHCFNPL